MTEQESIGAVCYGVSSGEYSGYGVARIFATRAEAEAWRDKQESDCRWCRGRETKHGHSVCTAAGLFIWVDDDECDGCGGTGRVNDYYVEEFPFGPEGAR